MSVSPPQTLRPKALNPGDTLAVISPSGPTRPEQGEPQEGPFAKGVALLQSAGFQVKLMPHARDQAHYLAGSDADRLSDLMAAFQDPEVDGILCARGGYGAMRLLPQLDMQVIAQNPKVFIGFSDITALHLAFYQTIGLVGFYGPMLTSNLIHQEPFSQQELLSLVRATPPIPYTVQNLDTYHCFTPGIAEAPLTGGNLSLLTALCGTPYQPQTAGHLLFIEDWREQYYSLDRKFQQLRLAGLLDEICGLILCDFSEIVPEPDYPLEALLKALTQDLKVPVGYGFSVGHGAQTATLPIGIRARFDATEGALTLLESPVV
jgi:muramoyltetrapeptide carboxypeptidase